MNAEQKIIGHWLAGEECFEEQNFEDLNPIDDGVYAVVARGSADTVDRAVRIAHETFGSYRASTPAQREGLAAEGGGASGSPHPGICGGPG